MSKIETINRLYIKGHINGEEYEDLISAHVKEEQSSADKIIELIGSMSVVELLETYKRADIEPVRLLIIAEVENRIG